MPNISVIIHTKNAENTVEKALRSVSLWANEVLVVDMKSEDRTVEIAKSFGAKILSVDDVKYADPVRNTAIEKAKGPWVLVLDADEEISSSLAMTLQKLSNDMTVHAYALPRKNMIFGQWAKTGWWPDYIIRFFQKDYVTWPPAVHSLPISTGVTMELEADEDNAIIHHNYDTVDQFIDRMNRYTSLEAEQKQDDQSLLNALFHEYMRRFFAEKGYKQGRYGLALSLLQSCYMLVSAIKLMEKKGFSTNNVRSTMQEVDNNLDEIYRDLCYWIADMHVQNTSSFVEKIYWKVRRKLKI
ncbi:MAG: glycosyltransferase family 2 protein [Candidatus Pacebacteria bacterium]|nr:glycosyltransferase family 2 protein [Candidatus Paceibacterota bacterium]